tara:strand:+ start:59 stop:688 length:630 start_codon:yes stop_codon:yes gene_type:complete
LNIIQDKLIKRSSKNYIQSILSKNTNWKVLDIGCGYTANKFATTICDIQDLSHFYKDKNFVRLDGKRLPFEDNHFDFIIASHVLEHVEDYKFFISELERVSSKGYIELPTKLEDNLVFENKKAHLWQMDFDDDNSKLLISNKLQFIEPILTVSMIQQFRKNFKSSLILELYWENKIDYDFVEDDASFEKLSLISLFRKYFSKKIRSIFS